jgi:hypothetical protein
MKLKKMNRGTNFEDKVYALLLELETVGLVHSVKKPDYIKDWYGNTRRVDVSFYLRSIAVEVLISVECKSHERPLAIDQIDQIRTFKNDLPRRNIFWLVFEGELNQNVMKTLKESGISYYSYDELKGLISSIKKSIEDNKKEILSLISRIRMFSTMDPSAQAWAEEQLEQLLLSCIPSPRK